MWFQNKIESLSKCGELPTSSLLIKYTPVLRQGILCVGGRLAEAPVTYWQHPIILPPDSHFTKLLVRDTHERLLHAGTELVLTQLRSTYFIAKLRQIINKEIKDCRPCRRLNIQPQIPKLPEARLANDQPAWTNTGIDLIGPLNVRERRSTIKVWVAIFVCLTTRAVHFEVLKDLSSDSVIMGLRSMMC